tara:strand:+ start:1623 stop:1898 length:276 start_codon:yes stop_codon:yes gene_type:complete
VGSSQNNAAHQQNLTNQTHLRSLTSHHQQVLKHRRNMYLEKNAVGVMMLWLQIGKMDAPQVITPVHVLVVGHFGGVLAAVCPVVIQNMTGR